MLDESFFLITRCGCCCCLTLPWRRACCLGMVLLPLIMLVLSSCFLLLAFFMRICICLDDELPVIIMRPGGEDVSMGWLLKGCMPPPGICVGDGYSSSNVTMS